MLRRKRPLQSSRPTRLCAIWRWPTRPYAPHSTENSTNRLCGSSRAWATIPRRRTTPHGLKSCSARRTARSRAPSTMCSLSLTAIRSCGASSRSISSQGAVRCWGRCRGRRTASVACGLTPTATACTGTWNASGASPDAATLTAPLTSTPRSTPSTRSVSISSA